MSLMTGDATRAVSGDQSVLEESVQMGCDDSSPCGTHLRSSWSSSAVFAGADGSPHSCADLIVVSRSHLTHGISTALARNDERMVGFVSTLRRVLREAEDDLRHQAAEQDDRLRTILNEAVRTERAHMSRSRNSALVLGPTSHLQNDIGSPPSFSSSGLITVSSVTSDLSSTTNQRRETVRRQYDMMNRLSTNYQAKRSRLRPSQWLLDSVHRAVVCLHHLFDTNRFHCTAVQNLVATKEFAALVCVMILANAAFLGVTQDILIKRSIDAHENEGVVSMNDGAISFLELFFTAAFAVELLLRLIAHEGRFCVGHGGRWNMFDAALVVSSCVDMFLTAVNVNLSMIRVLRVLRIIRTLRMVRLLRFGGTMKTLRLMILAIIQSAGALLIAVFILVILMFFFADIILNGVAVYIEDAHSGDPYVDMLQVYFSSMPMTLLTLFMSITGGVNWWEVQRLLLQIHVLYGVVFVCFISIMLLAVLNIITGIFVTDAVEMAASDQDVMMQAEQEMKLDEVKKLRQLFNRFNSAEKAVLTLADVESHIKDPEVQVILGMLGLDISAAPAFFKLLDVDQDGEVEIDEFVMGCLNLKGRTKQMDMEVTVQDTRRMVKKLVVGQQSLRVLLDRLAGSSSSQSSDPPLYSQSAPR